MPELPEVETIIRDLRRALHRKTVRNLLIFDKKISRPRIFFPQKIVGVTRHGKYVVCETDRGRFLVHLRMTGELLLGKSAIETAKQKHERARFVFGKGSHLRFVDQRRFGTIQWIEKGETLPVLGPDPLSPEFTVKVFYRAMQKSSRAIKSFLLDQRRVAGIGNIYADESLWMAKIHPNRKSNKIAPEEVKMLRKAIRRILREAIRMGGFTLRDYRRIDGSSGYYQNSRKAYNREGEACLRCRAKIKRIKLGGRSAYSCPRCQK